MLLRHGRVYPKSTTWTAEHRRWLSAQQFDEPASSLVFADLIAAVDGLTSRKTAIALRLSELATDERWWPTVARLRAFRGDRHADRAVDPSRARRRLEALRDRARAVGVARADAVAAASPASPPARARSPRPARCSPAGCWSSRPGTTAASRGWARRWPTASRPARPHPGHLQPRPATPAPRQPQDARPRQAAQRHRRRLRPRAGLLPLGRRHRRLTDDQQPHRSVGRGAGPSAAGTRDSAMSSTRLRAGATLAPRQRQPAARNRALGSQSLASSDWQRRHRARRPGPPTTPRRPPSGRDHPRPLDKPTAISAVVPEDVVHPGLPGG